MAANAANDLVINFLLTGKTHKPQESPTNGKPAMNGAAGTRYNCMAMTAKPAKMASIGIWAMNIAIPAIRR